MLINNSTTNTTNSNPATRIKRRLGSSDASSITTLEACLILSTCGRTLSPTTSRAAAVARWMFRRALSPLDPGERSPPRPSRPCDLLPDLPFEPRDELPDACAAAAAEAFSSRSLRLRRGNEASAATDSLPSVAAAPALSAPTSDAEFVSALTAAEPASFTLELSFGWSSGAPHCGQNSAWPRCDAPQVRQRCEISGSDIVRIWDCGIRIAEFENPLFYYSSL